MIDWLKAGKSAYYFRKRKRIPKAAISDMFRDLRQRADSPSKNIFSHLKEVRGGTHWSAISFFYEREPAFLELPDGHTKERVCGFLFLAEYRDHVVVFRSNLDLPSSFRNAYLQRPGDERVAAAVAQADATFEQIRLKNMAVSKHALRTKTLEAGDLQTVVSPSGSTRFVPRGYRVRRGLEYCTATPNTGRISVRADRTGYEELIDWGKAVIDLLVDGNASISPFIRSFARAIDLESLPGNVTPTFMAVDVPALTDDLFGDSSSVQLVRRQAGEDAVLTKDQAEEVLSLLEAVFEIRKSRSGELSLRNANAEIVGEIRIGKSRIALSRFTPGIEDVFVKQADGVIGGEDKGTPLKRYIDQNDLFTILFTDPAIVYLDGALFRDESLADGRVFLSYFRAIPEMSQTTSEKGSFAADQRSFDADSVFGVVTVHIAGRDELLVCDDLGDEWADFIGVDDRSQPKTISFYHAKHGEPTLSASALHVAVGQAMKNLGRMRLTGSDLEGKLEKWSEYYVNDNVATSIPRVMKGDLAEIPNRISGTLASPDTIRRVFIVTSSLSLQQLEETFASLRQGDAPKPYFVQLYWLLMSYFSACTEIGAFPYVLCHP